MPGKTLVVLGSGPGVGSAIARAFSVRGFTHIALVSRDAKRLAQDEDSVLDAIQERGYSARVKTWACDLTDFEKLHAVLKEIEEFGDVECVVFNAARVNGKKVLEEEGKTVEGDFRLTNLALYEVAQWAIPILKKAGESPDRSPTFIVPSTTQLWREPFPAFFSLSMVKSAQRALVLSLHHEFGKDVHVALLSIGGVVAPDKVNLSPDNIANKAWELYKQPRSQWEREVEIPE